MKHYAIAILASALFISGCGTTKPITLTETKHIAVKADKDLFHIEKAPVPIKAEEIKGKTKNEQLAIMGLKIIDLYGYIGTLQTQILTIQEEQDKIAERIEKETKK